MAAIIAGGGPEDPIGDVAGIAARREIGVIFGHGARHLIGTGLAQTEVEGTIATEVQGIASSAASTGNFWRQVGVNGQQVFYRAYTLPDGTINIGIYTVWGAMISVNEARFLTSLERRVFEILLKQDFPGKETVKDLLSDSMVKTIDDMGSLTILPVRPGQAEVVKSIPVEGEAVDSDGVPIHVLLHVKNGRPSELEIYKEDGSKLVSNENFNQLNAIALAPYPEKSRGDAK